MPFTEADHKELQEKYIMIKRSWLWSLVGGFVGLLLLVLIGRYWLLPGIIKEEVRKEASQKIIEELEASRAEAKVIISELKAQRTNSAAPDLSGAWRIILPEGKAGIDAAVIRKGTRKENEYEFDFSVNKKVRASLFLIDSELSLYRVDLDGKLYQHATLINRNVLLFHQSGEMWTKVRPDTPISWIM